MTNSTLISDVDPTSNPNRHVLPLPRIIAGGVAAAALLTGLSTEVGAEPVSDSVGHTSVMPEGWAPDYGSLSLDFPGVEASRAIDSNEDKALASNKSSVYGITTVSYLNREKGRPYIRPEQVELSCRREYIEFAGSWVVKLRVTFSGLVPNTSTQKGYTNGDVIYYKDLNVLSGNFVPKTLISGRRGNAISRSSYTTPMYNQPETYEKDAKFWNGEIRATLAPPYDYDLPQSKLAQIILGIKVPCTERK